MRPDIRLSAAEQDARRNPTVGVLIETGRACAKFRGLMIRGRCEVIEDPALVDTVVTWDHTKLGGRY